VRVLDLTRVLAGPTCARTLAEHGADVLHIASPKLPTFEALEIDTGHGKRQAWADLATVGGREVLRDLVQDSDVFSQGYRAGSLDRRGFGPRDVAKLRPGIVYVSINCFGHTGPWRERPGWEQLAQTVSGIVVGQGTDGMPETVPAAMNDYTTGYWGAYGAMTALARRAGEGGSWHVTVSLCQTSMWYERLGRSHSKDEAAVLEDVTAFSTTSETEWGRVTHLRPVVEMSETPTGWDQPTTPLGHDAPRWLSR
ncbi:MAG TPA: CoA transferase, partial [Armatimonadota bacterium]|nr:CoA transferase [Armatimonadota bacterium]